ncbi:MAG: fimbrillin family protein [Muribaculaceae bacterium]|nr:fimbrillin family protein [Muribaculaceae bacterium]
MNFLKSQYIYILIVFAVSLFAWSCADDELYVEPEHGNPDAVTFSASALPASDDDLTRGSDEGYEPLVLKSEGSGQPLYLHTYDSPRIGFTPGDGFSNSQSEIANPTRANQISSVQGLVSFHKNFKVLATRNADKAVYIPWVDTRHNESDNNIWYTNRTEYWPGKDVLNFSAVSPASEFSNLKSLTASDNVISFGYEARKSPVANKDAEYQPDLLLAGLACNKEGSVDGRVPLNFHHALSAVKFAVRDVLEGEVVNIKISGVRSSGNCNFSYDPSSGLGNIIWDSQSGTETYSQNFNYKVAGNVVNPSDETKDEVMNAKMPEKTFMLIPQEIPADAEIIVTLKRTGLEDVTLRGKIRDNNVTEWKPGHEYVYTISTTKSNWTYVLKATGNHKKSNNKHNVDGDQIYVYSPSKSDHDKYGDDAYFKVRSFRYRTNNQTYMEELPWTASHSGTDQYDGTGSIIENRYLNAEEWIPTRSALRGDGNFASDGERRDISMIAHTTLSTWEGDRWMQNQKAYTGNSASKPWDLSKAGTSTRNTANCYVIDRQGWYSFPLYYGNSVKNNVEKKSYPTNFKNHAGATITAGKISSAYYGSAAIVWSDVYNAISDVQLKKVGSEYMIVFKANQFSLQQGNVVIALYSGDNATGDIVWSWHIWINEHWLDPKTGLSNALSASTSTFAYEATASGWRNRGDLRINNNYVASSKNYWVAPYNIGWCDPKNIDYLKRQSTMVFEQKDKDGNPTGLKTSLPIIQDGERIRYEYGNNTYYQWGRKDPIVGFVDHHNKDKRNFGPKQQTKGKQPVSLATSIKNPQKAYYAAAYNNNDSKVHDWLSAGARNSNYWNNGGKTIYDPCPAGYKVPPTECLKFIGPDNNGKFDNANSNNKRPLTNFQGKINNSDDPYVFQVSTRQDLTRSAANSLWLTCTGNRWYCDGHPSLKDTEGNPLQGGDNFNPTIVYLWSYDEVPTNNLLSYGLALGIDTQFIADVSKPNEVNKNGNIYVMCSYFTGRKAMARPIRPIRE